MRMCHAPACMHNNISVKNSHTTGQAGIVRTLSTILHVTAMGNSDVDAKHITMYCAAALPHQYYAEAPRYPEFARECTTPSVAITHLLPCAHPPPFQTPHNRDLTLPSTIGRSTGVR